MILSNFPRWQLRPDGVQGLDLHLEGQAFTVKLEVFYDGQSYFTYLTSCCGARSMRRAEARYCNECKASLPEAESDAEYLGEPLNAVEDWLMGSGVEPEPLNAGLIASELRDLAKLLDDWRRICFFAQMDSHGLKWIAQNGHAAHANNGVILPWTSEVMDFIVDLAKSMEYH